MWRLRHQNSGSRPILELTHALERLHPRAAPSRENTSTWGKMLIPANARTPSAPSTCLRHDRRRRNVERRHWDGGTRYEGAPQHAPCTTRIFQVPGGNIT